MMPAGLLALVVQNAYTWLMTSWRTTALLCHIIPDVVHMLLHLVDLFCVMTGFPFSESPSSISVSASAIHSLTWENFTSCEKNILHLVFAHWPRDGLNICLYYFFSFLLFIHRLAAFSGNSRYPAICCISFASRRPCCLLHFLNLNSSARHILLYF